MTDCGFEHEAGAYVLGALSPEDRAAFERHVAHCEACAGSVRELAGLPGLLARVPVEAVTADRPQPPVPDTLLPRLLRRARSARRRRGLATAGLVAAVAAVALWAGWALATGTPDPGSTDPGSAGSGSTETPTTPSQAPGQPSTPPTAAPQRFAAVGSTQISGWVSLTSVPWGTRIEVTCAYPGGAPPGYQGDSAAAYTLEVTRTDGSTEQVASWTGVAGESVRVTAATAAEKADVSRVVVRGADGRAVLRLNRAG